MEKTAQTIRLTREQARRFILIRQGLLGGHRFVGKAGACAYVKQAGCIQFDPVDVCGRNAELTLQARVKGFTKKVLSDLLYQDRLLVDYCDKELAIWHRDDWPYFEDYRQRSREHGRQFFSSCICFPGPRIYPGFSFRQYYAVAECAYKITVAEHELRDGVLKRFVIKLQRHGSDYGRAV